MPTATVEVGASDANNEDARSTSSTLVNGENCNRQNESEQDGRQREDRLSVTSNHNTSTVRHGFDHGVHEDELLSYLHFSEKRHETNGKPNPAVRNLSLDWVTFFILFIPSSTDSLRFPSLCVAITRKNKDSIRYDNKELVGDGDD